MKGLIIMLFSNKNILLEASNSIYNKVLNISELQKHFKVVKIVENGNKKNETNEKLFFVRVFFTTKEDDMFTLEFRSRTEDMKLVHSIVIYNMKMNNDITIYADGDKPIDKFIEFIKEKTTSKSMVGLNESFFSSLKPDLIVAMIVPVITLVWYGLWLGRQYKIRRDEADSINAEKELNEFLFKGQKKDEPAFDVYSHITQHINNVAAGNRRSLILYGKPGTSKTYLVRRCLHFSNLEIGKDYNIISGSAGDPSAAINLIYETLWRYNEKLIIFDDFDSVLDNLEAVNLLKAAMDSYPVRIVSMPISGGFEEQRLPKSFNFKGNILIITNKTEIDPALMSRATTIRVEFTPDEFKDHIGKLLKFISPHVDDKIKEEVFEFLCKQKDVDIDFRRFGGLVDLRVANPDNWKELSKSILYQKK
jgi:hypothetical protein